MNKKSSNIKLTLLLLSGLTVMSGATIAPSLPVMLVHYSAVNNVEVLVRLVLTIPALFILFVAPLAGMFIDTWGRKKLLLPAMVIFGIAGSSGLYLDSLGAILAGRALLGVAVAGVMTSVTTLVADYFEGNSRARFMGLQAAFMGLGGVVFLISGGLLADIQWRLPFAIYTLSFALIPIAYFTLSEPVRKENSNTSSEHPADTLDKIDISDDTPYNRVKPVTLIYSTALFTMITFYIIPTQLPFYLDNLAGINPSLSGIAIGTAILFSSVVALLYARIRRSFGYITILGMSFGFMGAGYLWISFIESYTLILAGLAVCGIGMGLSMPNFTMWLTSEVPASVRGRAVGGLTTAIFMGQFISPVISQPLSNVFGLALTFQYAGIMLIIFGLIFLSGHRRISSFIKPEIKMKNEVIVPAQNHKHIPETNECIERAT